MPSARPCRASSKQASQESRCALGTDVGCILMHHLPYSWWAVPTLRLEQHSGASLGRGKRPRLRMFMFPLRGRHGTRGEFKMPRIELQTRYSTCAAQTPAPRAAAWGSDEPARSRSGLCLSDATVDPLATARGSDRPKPPRACLRPRVVSTF